MLYLSSYSCQLIFNIITPLELRQLRSTIILAVLFPFPITGIAVFIILQLSLKLYWYFLCWVLQTIFHWCCHTMMRLELLQLRSTIIVAVLKQMCDWIFTDIFSIGYWRTHYDAIGTSATSSIVILAVLLPFQITGIALLIILQLSLKLYWYFLCWVLQTIFHWCWHTITPWELQLLILPLISITAPAWFSNK